MGLDLLGDTVGKLGRPAELALVNVSCWVTCAYRHASLGTVAAIQDHTKHQAKILER